MATVEFIDHETAPKERLICQSNIGGTKTYQLSPEVRQSVERAMQQVHDGQTISGETVWGEIDEWLGNDD